MNGMYAATVLVCASMAAEAPEQWLAAGKAPLHAHPTLVRMWERNNELRASVGLAPHRLSPELTKAAQDHAVYMARTGDFDHYGNGGPWARAARWGFTGGISENIAMGQGDVMGAFSAWQFSGGHWANLTSNTTEAGFGHAVSANGTPYWVAVYGSQ
ncbi:MAG: CAP domain-containing protein [Planctomycetes bacterium]|nr:CAP domain-containing protein [Planctomycetota bacterium]